MAEEQEQKHGAGEDSQGDQDKAPRVRVFVGDVREDDVAKTVFSLAGQVAEGVFIIISVSLQRPIVRFFPRRCRIEDPGDQCLCCRVIDGEIPVLCFQDVPGRVQLVGDTRHVSAEHALSGHAAGKEIIHNGKRPGRILLFFFLRRRVSVRAAADAPRIAVILSLDLSQLGLHIEINALGTAPEIGTDDHPQRDRQDGAYEDHVDEDEFPAKLPYHS